VARELRVFAFAHNGNGATWFPAVVGNPEFKRDLSWLQNNEQAGS
jgi:hypothetical protein